MTATVMHLHTCKKVFSADLFSNESLQLFRPPPKPISRRRLKKTMDDAVRAHTLDLLNNSYLIGGQIIEPQVTLIDWLTITIPDTVLFHGLKRPENHLRRPDVLAVYTAKAEQLAKLCGLRLATTMKTGRNLYQYRYDLLANDKKRLKGAFVTFGGNGGLCLSLSAQACRIAFATEERFAALGSQLVKDQAQIAQIHIALDAHHREFTAASVVDDYRTDKTIFRVRGRAGRLPRMEWTVVDEPTGERINHARVGSKAKDAKKYQTFYEKPDGRTRAELRLRRDPTVSGIYQSPSSLKRMLCLLVHTFTMKHCYPDSRKTSLATASRLASKLSQTPQWSGFRTICCTTTTNCVPMSAQPMGDRCRP